MLCPICFQTNFTSIDTLQASLIRAANGPLSCPICQEQFLGLDKLTIHLFSHTTFKTAADQHSAPAVLTRGVEEQPLSTPAGSISIVEQSTMNTAQGPQLLQSVIKTADVRYNKKLKKQKSTHVPGSNIDTHSGSPQSNVSKTLESSVPALVMPACDICELTFHNENLRDMHLRLVHQIGYTNIRDEPASPAAPTTQQSKESCAFKCHLCPKSFKMKGSLRVHLKVVHMMGIAHVKTAVEQSKNLTTQNASIAEPSLRNANHFRSENDIYTKTVIPTPIATVNSMPNSPSNINTSTDKDLSCSYISSGKNNLSSPSVDVNFNQLAPQIFYSLDTFNIPTLSPPALAAIEDTSVTGSSNDHAAGLSVSLAAVVGENAKIWECDVCSKSFTTKYFLKKHKRLHTGEMPYTCEICGRTFTFQQSYHKHLLYHSDEKPHVCSTCGRRFKELSTLHNHERIHSGEKPFKCEVCGKCFRQRVSFLVHTRIHTGVMPYKCQTCQKSFRYKVSQRTHKCLKPDETGTTPSNLSPTAVRPENGTEHEPVSEDFIKAFLETAINGLNGEESSPQSIIEGLNGDEASRVVGCGSTHGQQIEQQQQQLNTSTKQQIIDEAFLSKTIDDIVVESCKKLGIGTDVTSTHFPTTASQIMINSENSAITTLHKANSMPQMSHDRSGVMSSVEVLNSLSALHSKEGLFKTNY